MIPVLMVLPSSSRRALGVVTPDSTSIISFISQKQNKVLKSLKFYEEENE